MIHFIDIANELIGIPIVLTLMVYFLGWVKLYYSGGLKKNLPYAFVTVVCFQYLYLSPLFFYSEGRRLVLHTTDVGDYYGIGAWCYLFVIILLNLGYWFTTTKTKKYVPQNYEITNPQKKIVIMFIVIYSVIILNMIVGGIDVKSVFFSGQKLGLGAKGATYYLMNLTDSLITVILLGYFFKINKVILSGIIGVSFFLFMLLGFRYRIILSLFGMFFIWLILRKIDTQLIIRAIVLVVIGGYGILFISINRYNLYNRNGDVIVYNPAEFDYYILFDQTRGALADFAVFQLFNEKEGTEQAYRFLPVPETGIVEHDYGLTMFLYPIIRAIPRTIYPNKDIFYPAPTLKVKDMAYSYLYKHRAGEATLFTGELYISFGLIGMLIGSFLLGFLLRTLSAKLNIYSELGFLTYIIITIILFQWLTRGFLPQVVDHFTYMMIPIFIMYRYRTKLSMENNNLSSNTNKLNSSTE